MRRIKSKERERPKSSPQKGEILDQMDMAIISPEEILLTNP